MSCNERLMELERLIKAYNIKLHLEGDLEWLIDYTKETRLELLKVYEIIKDISLKLETGNDLLKEDIEIIEELLR